MRKWHAYCRRAGFCKVEPKGPTPVFYFACFMFMLYVQLQTMEDFSVTDNMHDSVA